MFTFFFVTHGIKFYRLRSITNYSNCVLFFHLRLYTFFKYVNLEVTTTINENTNLPVMNMFINVHYRLIGETPRMLCEHMT